jgi:hypothetical protein
MTYDDFGSAYYGSFVDIQTHGNATVLRTPGGNRSVIGGKKQNDIVNYDKAVVVVNGSGAGQYRRLIEWDWANDPSKTSTWQLDSPFAFTPEPDAMISIMPFRGRNIFYRNEHSDSGAWQLYGAGIENLAVELTGERMGGFLSVGMGNDQGSNMNLFNQFVGITVTEGLRADHREESLTLPGGNYSAPTPGQQRCLQSTGNDTLHCGTGFVFGDRLSGLAEVNSFSIVPSACSQSQAEVITHTSSNPRRLRFQRPNELRLLGSCRRISSFVVFHLISLCVCSVCLVLSLTQGGIDTTRFVVLRRNTVESNGGFFLDGGSDIILEHNTVSNFESGFSAAPLTRGGNYKEQPLSAPPPFAITNVTGAEGCPKWGCNQWCRGAQGVVARGNRQV